jgi:REP element-mobilizing transposase RayT
MLRRRVGHDYQSRRIYLITMTVEGRRPLLGQFVGDADAPDGTPDAPHIDLSPLGEQVRAYWQAIPQHYPTIKVLATQVMPDHLHGILFVQQQMDQHIGQAIKGFKIACNKAYRQLFPYAATLLQQRETGGRGHGYLWARNYNDHILEYGGELDRWFSYLQDNPRRLAIRRAHPDYFRVVFGLTIDKQTCSAIGNRFLLTYPQKSQIQCSRSLTAEDVKAVAASTLAMARKGVIPVSPAISKGEQLIARTLRQQGFPLVILLNDGFPKEGSPHER